MRKNYDSKFKAKVALEALKGEHSATELACKCSKSVGTIMQRSFFYHEFQAQQVYLLQYEPALE
jgi:hypothetical protein